jgi:hypothetical protein
MALVRRCKGLNASGKLAGPGVWLSLDKQVLIYRTELDGEVEKGRQWKLMALSAEAEALLSMFCLSDKRFSTRRQAAEIWQSITAS